MLVSVTFTVLDVTLKVPFHPAAMAEGAMANSDAVRGGAEVAVTSV